LMIFPLVGCKLSLGLHNLGLQIVLHFLLHDEVVGLERVNLGALNPDYGVLFPNWELLFEESCVLLCQAALQLLRDSRHRQKRHLNTLQP
jgi:hypothetical protein